MKQKNHHLNSVSAGTEAVMHVVLALFSLCCIIPFIFGVIISKQVLGLSENYAARIVPLPASTPSLTPPTSR